LKTDHPVSTVAENPASGLSITTETESFRAARDADPKGKYGALALEQLKQHSAWGQ